MTQRRDDEPSAVFNRRGQARPVQRPGGGPRDEAPGDRLDDLGDFDEFTPPNPKNPLAGAKPGVVVGAALLIFGILALIVVPFLPLNAPSWTVPALIAVVVLGVAVLFMQMPRSRTGGGDGAQV